jgi:molecular chaperone GrpE (heat shock protein)
LSDQENTRHIAQNNVRKTQQYAINSFAKSLLDVLDNLQHALELIPKEQVEALTTTTTKSSSSSSSNDNDNAKSLLDVSDNLQRALESIPKEQV